MTWGITNGAGTVNNTGMSEKEARRAAQQRANDGRETFFVYETDVTYPAGSPHYGLGEPVEPEHQHHFANNIGVIDAGGGGLLGGYVHSQCACGWHQFRAKYVEKATPHVVKTYTGETFAAARAKALRGARDAAKARK